MKNKFTSLLALISITIFSCNKAGTLTVTVNKMPTGQVLQTAAGVEVLVRNTSDSLNFYEGLTSAQGVTVINNIKQGSYQVSSQVWDGSKTLYGEETVSVQKGKNTNVGLLIQ